MRRDWDTCTQREDDRKTQVDLHKHKREASEEINSVDALIMDFQPPRL